MPDPVRNWLGNVVSTPSSYHRPTSSDEIATLVHNAPGRVQFVGSRFSKTPILDCTDATVVDMTGLSQVLHIGDGTVTVQGGCTIYDVSKALFEHGRQLPAFLFTANPTIGGAVAAPTKGDNRVFTGERDTLSAFVQEAKVLRADGSIATIAAGTDEMALLKESYGMIGGLLEATIETAPLRRARTHSSFLRLDAFLASEELIARSLTAQLMIMPKLGWVVLRDRSEVTEPGKPDVPFESLIHDHGEPAYARVARTMPQWLARPMLKMGLRFQKDSVEDAWHLENMRTYANPRDQRRIDFVQWAVPLEQYVETLREAISFCAKHPDFPVDALIESYHIARERRFFTDRDQVAIDPFIMSFHPRWESFYRDYNALLMARNGTPFLNQTRNLPDGALTTCFGDKASEWRETIRGWDPESRFWNPSVDRLLARS